MYTIQTLNKISKAGTDKFDSSAYVVADTAENPDAIMVRSASMHDMEFGSNLLAIARAGAGVNNIPVDRCAEEGICVFNTPGANANAVKELVLTGLLISSRKIPASIKWAASLENEGDSIGKLVEKGKSNFAGPEIQGKTLGIIGLGAIGALVANAAVSLGMQVVGTDPFLSVGAALRLKPSVKVVKTQEDVFAEADYLTIHVPYNKDTKGMINAETISKMKDGVRILNYARGELVDDDAILEALASGKVACYCTDFPNAKTCNAEGIIATPHLGASTPESEDNCASMAAQELIDYLETGNISNSVNLPNAQMNARGTKVCILHTNVPSMISTVTAEAGKLGLNIENMVNASRGNYAYTMLEIMSDVPQKMADDLLAIDGVIRVRIIAK
ncbi:MAG: 3-phosphoglycerate dehydrogenase [Ruminococcus sp.]|nr:3-phosphoglycerate dehydrogenase [Ruminococcus sp.]